MGADTLTRPAPMPACPACGATLSPRLSEADGALFGAQTGYVCQQCGVICDMTGQEIGG